MPIARLELIDLGNNADQYLIAEEAQPVQLAQLAQPAPVSMFDLVPGRRYIISNRQVDAWQHPQQGNPVFNSYRPNQSTFVATFICLSRPQVSAPKDHRFHPINFLEGIDQLERFSELGGPNPQSRYTGRSLGMIMENSDVYPIFSYEQGLPEEQLEDLTLELELEWIRGNMAARGGGHQSMEYRTLHNFNGVMMPALTEYRDTQRREVIEGYEALMFNRTKRDALPGLLYFGHDEHSQLYKNYSRSFGAHVGASAEERNFKYSLLKRWSTGWYNSSSVETYFNAPELLQTRPGLTPIKRELLRHNLMIVLPRYWSFTYDPQYQDDLQPGEAEIMAGRIRRGDNNVGQGLPRQRRERAGRRALDGGRKKRIKTKKNKRTRRKRRKKRTRNTK
jgi:hypothetical protein